MAYISVKVACLNVVDVDGCDNIPGWQTQKHTHTPKTPLLGHSRHIKHRTDADWHHYTHMVRISNVDERRVDEYSF